MKTLSRGTWLFLGLMATAAVAAFGDMPESHYPVVAPAVHLPRIRSLVARREMPVVTGDPFAPALPVTAPAVMVPPAVPSEPVFQAALPWRAIGKLQQEGEGWTVFLANGGATRVVRVGDTLDEAYRVTEIAPPKMALLHVRHKTRVTLDIGEAKE